MLIRSSSTPILGSLLSTNNHFNESPNNHNHSHNNNLEKCHSLGFKRTQSDGNLKSLTSVDNATSHVLDTIPSFSMYSSNEQFDENEDDDDKGKDAIDEAFSFMDVSHNCHDGNALPLFLARGLGIDRLGSGLLSAGNIARNGGARSELENYYRRMIDENPNDALFLSNYAQLLYQKKGDAKRAEEYYSRAILAEPGNGEILSQYAKLVWELHKDKERSSSYFEQAVQAAPSDSLVLAAYANFLWETDDDEEICGDEGHSEGFVEAVPMCHEIMALF